MVKQNVTATRIKPQTSQLLTLHVVRTERISPTFIRVTLGGGDIDRFLFMGFDQWFRLFIPVADSSILSRLPDRLDMFAYLRFLSISKTERPVLRNYSVRAFRESGHGGPELDVDFVLHGSAAEGTSGPAASWAQTCGVGDAVAILDEGIAYNPPAGVASGTFLVADESGLPGAAGILASLPRDAGGIAVIETPHADDAQDLDAPDGVDVRWVVRADPHAVPGAAALAEALAVPTPSAPFYGWAVGEQRLPVAMRRHWVQSGVDKHRISFCGYWKSAVAAGR